MKLAPEIKLIKMGFFITIEYKLPKVCLINYGIHLFADNCNSSLSCGPRYNREKENLQPGKYK